MGLPPVQSLKKGNIYTTLKIATIVGCITYLFFPSIVFAADTSSDITNYTNDTLNILTLIAASAAVFFLIKGGYLYITSTGRPDVLEEAKKTIKNSLIGLVLVLGASLIVNILSGALTGSSATDTSLVINLVPLTPTTPSNGLSQVLIDAISAVLQNIVESATKPVVDAIIGYLTTTPSVLHNAVISKFWLITLGITDSLYVLVVAILGLHLMSASTFGFEEVELKQILPRLGLSFLGANISLFLADYVIVTCNALVSAVLNATGGLDHAWVVNAITFPGLVTNTVPLVTLLFFVLFLILAIVLLLMYISRLIVICAGAVLAPFIFLLWAIPKLSDFAEIAVKTYIVTVFTVFVQVVIIQLASSFLALSDQPSGSLISIVIAIGLFFTLLKTPQTMMQMMFYTSGNVMMRKIGGQMMNIMTSQKPETPTSLPSATKEVVKVSRRVVDA